MLWSTEEHIYFVSLSLFQCYDVIYIQQIVVTNCIWFSPEGLMVIHPH